MNITTAKGDATLQIENFCVYRNNIPAVKDLTLPPIKPGSLCAILGPNGSGKTTLLEGLTSSLRTNGVAKLGKISLSDLPTPRQKTLVYLPQSSMSAPHLTLIEALGHALGLRSSRSQSHVSLLLGHLEKLGLTEHASSYLDELSGGQRQRYAITQILAQPAPLILMDEPLNNLDPKYQKQLLEHLGTIARDEHKIILLTLHDLNMALRFCPLSLLLKDGEKIAFGATQAILIPENIRKTFEIDVVREQGQRGTQFITML